MYTYCVAIKFFLQKEPGAQIIPLNIFLLIIYNNNSKNCSYCTDLKLHCYVNQKCEVNCNGMTPAVAQCDHHTTEVWASHFDVAISPYQKN